MVEIPREWLRDTTYTPGEVAAIFGVTSYTVARWAKTGRIGFYRSPVSGNRCYPESEVQRLVNGQPAPAFIKELAKQDDEVYSERLAEMNIPKDHPVWGRYVAKMERRAREKKENEESNG